jgi:hypothetical protein
MPFYEAGDHKVDHPPLFACREHKQFLRLRASFVNELVKSLEDMVPGNLHEIAAPYVNNDTNAFKLPDYLVPPRVLIYNPDGLRGPAALPFTLVFIDKRFIGIPASYLTARCFEGCPDCPEAPLEGARIQRPVPTQQSASGPHKAAAANPAKSSPNLTGSAILRPGTVPPQKKPSPAAPAPAPRPAGAPGGAPKPAAPKPAAPPPRPPQR